MDAEQACLGDEMEWLHNRDDGTGLCSKPVRLYGIQRPAAIVLGIGTRDQFAANSEIQAPIDLHGVLNGV